MFPFKYLYPRQPDPRRYRASRFRNNVETPREGNSHSINKWPRMSLTLNSSFRTPLQTWRNQIPRSKCYLRPRLIPIR